MSRSNETVQVAVALPKDIYDRVEQAAAYEQRQVEDLLSTLVAEGLNAHATVRELLEQVSTQYRARLANEGKLNQTPDEVLQELRNVREQIASEIYP